MLRPDDVGSRRLTPPPILRYNTFGFAVPEVRMAFPLVTSLDGRWRLRPTTAFQHGRYPADDAGWIEQDLPAHWQSHPLLEHYTGRMLYRRSFSHATIVAGQRHWLRCNGVFYRAQAYFNEVDLGQHEGYFAPYEREITRWLAEDNTLLFEVECRDERDRTNKRQITGVFSHWDSIDPEANPGGFWLPIEIITTGAARLHTVRLHTSHANPAAAVLRFSAEIDATGTHDAALRWTFAPHNIAGEVQTFVERRTLIPGTQTLVGSLTLRDPQLWWSHDMGHPALYDVTCEVLIEDIVSDLQQFRYGVRTFELRDWIPYLNGERLFAKGNNYPPTDVRLASVTYERCAADLELARACNMNMLRVHAHVPHPTLLDAADAMGMLLWQDFPLQWLYAADVFDEAARQARLMIRQLGNHPSIVIWCMHNEPVHVVDTRRENFLSRLRVYWSLFVWNDNRNVLDARLKQLAETEDPTRPVVRASGEYAIPGVRAGGDAHYYFGWYTMYGPLRAFERVMQLFPVNLRFVTEFGAQSFPNLASSERFLGSDISQIDWEYVAARHQLQPEMLAHWVDWRSAPSLAALVDLTQDYQVEVNRFYIDRLRLHKYRPAGGCLPFMFHDANPSVSWSILDYWRVPKRSYAAMQLAYSTQYAFTILEQDHYAVGAPIEIPVYLVNDARTNVQVRLSARIIDPEGIIVAARSRNAMLAADSMAMEVERLQLTPPASGRYTLQLRWSTDTTDELVNTYEIHVDA